MSAPAAPSVPPPQTLTGTHWLILIIASIGFAFDIYELLMLPLVLPPALEELLPNPEQGRALWLGLMFWVPAMGGGLFGLLGGYLTDRLGRRRVLTWSILLYAISAFLAGFSTSMPMLLVLRTTTFIGVCVEFVAAVAWLAELFPNPQQRERVLGYTQAFSSIGGLLVSLAFLLATKLARPDATQPELHYLPPIIMPDFLVPLLGEVRDGYAPWRYTLMSGIIPALPLIIIRPFLPESPVWKQKKEAGTLRRPSFGELFSPALRRTTFLTMFMVACTFGAAFGAIQQMAQIVPALPDVRAEMAATVEIAKLQAKSEGTKLDPKTASDLIKTVRDRNAGQLQTTQEIGGLVGRFVFALIVVAFVSRRWLLRIFQIPGLVLVPLTFAVLTLNNDVLLSLGDVKITYTHLGIFLVGFLTVAQMSFWGNYLPLVFPTHLRGTGESMAHNIGGRMIGTSFAALAAMLSTLMPDQMWAPIQAGLTGRPAPDPNFAFRMAYAAAIVGFTVYLIGLILSCFLPEPKEEMVHE